MTSPITRQYRQERAAVSGSALYREPSAPAARPNPFSENTYQGLQQYADKQVDPLELRQGESVEAYRRRLGNIARALPDGEVERRLAAVEQVPQTTSHDELRQHLDSRQSGAGRGIFGATSGAEQAAALARQPMRNSMSESEVAMNGHLLGAVGGTCGQVSVPRIFATDLAQNQRQPQRTAIPSGSSAEGWSTNRG